jgi:hypothetical protein
VREGGGEAREVEPEEARVCGAERGEAPALAQQPDDVGLQELAREGGGLPRVERPHAGGERKSERVAAPRLHLPRLKPSISHLWPSSSRPPPVHAVAPRASSRTRAGFAEHQDVHTEVEDAGNKMGI